MFRVRSHASGKLERPASRAIVCRAATAATDARQTSDHRAADEQPGGRDHRECDGGGLPGSDQ